MRKLVFIPLLLLLTGCPKPEVTARDAIAGAHGYVVYGQSEWKAECTATPTQGKCQLVNKLIAGEHTTADLLAVYCSGTPKAGAQPYAQGGECVEVKSAYNALSASVANIQDLIKQVNMFLPQGTKVQPVAPGGK